VVLLLKNNRENEVPFDQFDSINAGASELFEIQFVDPDANITETQMARWLKANYPTPRALSFGVGDEDAGSDAVAAVVDGRFNLTRQ
jgi:hypothetical protein